MAIPTQVLSSKTPSDIKPPTDTTTATITQLLNTMEVLALAYNQATLHISSLTLISILTSALLLTSTPIVYDLENIEANEHLHTILVHSKILMLSLDIVTCIANAAPNRIVNNIELYDDNHNIHNTVESRGTEINSNSVQKSTSKTLILHYNTNGTVRDQKSLIIDINSPAIDQCYNRFFT